MGIYKITDDSAFVSCRCGEHNEFPVESFKLGYRQISSPPCPKCKFVFGFIGKGDWIKEENVNDIQIVIQTLGKRKILAHEPDPRIEPPKEEAFRWGKKWKKGMVLECDIHPSLKAARKQRQAE